MNHFYRDIWPQHPALYILGVLRLHSLQVLHAFAFYAGEDEVCSAPTGQVVLDIATHLQVPSQQVVAGWCGASRRTYCHDLPRVFNKEQIRNSALSYV